MVVIDNRSIYDIVANSREEQMLTSTVHFSRQPQPPSMCVLPASQQLPGSCSGGGSCRGRFPRGPLRLNEWSSSALPQSSPTTTAPSAASQLYKHARLHFYLASDSIIQSTALTPCKDTSAIVQLRQRRSFAAYPRLENRASEGRPTVCDSVTGIRRPTSSGA